jgi:transcription elongation factor Elf1
MSEKFACPKCGRKRFKITVITISLEDAIEIQSYGDLLLPEHKIENRTKTIECLNCAEVFSLDALGRPIKIEKSETGNQVGG